MSTIGYHVTVKDSTKREPAYNLSRIGSERIRLPLTERVLDFLINSYLKASSKSENILFSKRFESSMNVKVKYSGYSTPKLDNTLSVVSDGNNVLIRYDSYTIKLYGMHDFFNLFCSLSKIRDYKEEEKHSVSNRFVCGGEFKL